MKKLLIPCFVLFLSLINTNPLGAEELKTIIKPDGKIMAEILLSEGANFTSKTTGMWRTGEYDRRSPIKTWNNHGLIQINGQHLNLLYGLSGEGNKKPWASASYLSLDGYVTEINKKSFKARLIIQKNVITDYEVDLLPCRIEGYFTFTFYTEDTYKWGISDKDYPELSNCFTPEGEKQTSENIFIFPTITELNKHSDYLLKELN